MKSYLFMTEKITVTADLGETRVFKIRTSDGACIEAPWKHRIYNVIRVTIASSFIEFEFLYNNDDHAGGIFIDFDDNVERSLEALACNVKEEDLDKIYNKLKENLSNLISKINQIYAIISLLT